MAIHEDTRRGRRPLKARRHEGTQARRWTQPRHPRAVPDAQQRTGTCAHRRASAVPRFVRLRVPSWILLPLLVAGILRAQPQDAPALAAPPIVASGLVLRPDGAPVAHAEVWLVVPEDSGMRRRRLATTTTNDGGFYELRAELPRPDAESRLQVIILPPDFGATAAWVPYGGFAETRVMPAATVKITVLDPDGRPAPDVRLRPARLSAPDGAVLFPDMIDDDDPLWHTTDDKGQLTIQGLPEMSVFTLAVGDPRYAARLGFGLDPGGPDGSIFIRPGAERQTAPPLRLRPAGSISGRVVYSEAGEPAAGIPVEIRRAGWAVPLAVVLSGHDGTYRVGQLAADRYNILVRASDEFLRSWTYEELDNVTLMPGQDLAGQDLKLVRGAAIAGKVLTADTREPVAGVSVLVQGSPYGRRPDRRWDLATGEDGGYLLRVPPGEYVVSLRPFAPSQWVNPKTLVVVTAEDGATAAADFELPRNTAPFVRGVVVGPDGQPARQARVSISSRVGISSGQTDGEGRFAVRLPVAEGGTLTASLEGAWPSVGVPVRGGEDLRVELRPAPAVAYLVGMVNDEQGLPIAGAFVEPRSTGTRRALERTGPWRVRDINGEQIMGNLGGQQPVWQTNSAGLYAIRIDPPPPWAAADDEPPARYSVVAWAKGYAPAASAEVERPTAGEGAVPAIVLRRAASSVSGEVVDSAGRGVSGVGVAASFPAYPDLRRGPSTETDEQGRFTIDGLAAGETVILRAYAPQIMASAAIRPPAAGVRLQLRPLPAPPPAGAADTERGAALQRLQQAQPAPQP